MEYWRVISPEGQMFDVLHLGTPNTYLPQNKRSTNPNAETHLSQTTN
jgi:hypothetical protein